MNESDLVFCGDEVVNGKISIAYIISSPSQHLFLHKNEITGHSAANAVARIGSLTAPFLIEGKSSLLQKGLVMLAIHSITVFCVSQLPETKGSHFGRVHGNEEEEEEEDHDDDHAVNHHDHDLALSEEISNIDIVDGAVESSNNNENTTTHHHQIT